MTDRFSADDLSRISGGAPRTIDLAHGRPFNLHDVEVLPASRELVRGRERMKLEPLVMQVLVALHSAKGATLSRDDLIDACWGGRAISDDAISRVISRLRALGNQFGTFQVETIPKIGYRLVASGDGAAANSPNRRYVLAGGAATALALLGFAGLRLRQPEPDPEFGELLIQKGMNALQRNDALDLQDPGSTLEAIALLTDATRAAPESASAWGALALALAVRKRSADVADRPGLDARSRTAAQKALDLNAHEERAHGALRLLDPVYRNWARAERETRRAAGKNPRLPILLFLISDVLGSVGRWQEALQFSSQLDRRNFLIPGADRKLIIDYWGSGNLQGADDALDTAVRHWPQHPQVWQTRIAYLMFSGRAREALAILQSANDRPPELRPDYFETVRTTAEALSGLRRKDDAIAALVAYLKAYPRSVPLAVQGFAALGRTDSTFDLLDGYYFGEGEWSWAAPIAGDQDRLTNFLFLPVAKPLWDDRRFRPLLERIGLEDYWRRTGTTPDFRRTA